MLHKDVEEVETGATSTAEQAVRQASAASYGMAPTANESKFFDERII